METSVLLSIKPEFVDSIFTGAKQFEFRRKIFKNREVKRVIIYATSPVKKVVGEFEIDEIIESEISDLWEKTRKKSGIGKAYFESYFTGIDVGYAIKIKHFIKYESPMELIDDFNINQAPQFFTYLDKLPQSIKNLH